MRTKIMLTAGLLAMLAITSIASADTIVGTGSDSWQAFSAPNENGLPYWDQLSMDGSQRNVGYFISNTGFYAGGSGPGAIPFWGSTGGNQMPGAFSFSNNYPNDSAGLFIEIAGWASSNEFGWYDTATPLILNPILLGSDSPLVSAFFNPSANYGFYFMTLDGTFYTQPSLNTVADTVAGDRNQHFAVFSETNSQVYWIGMEDTLYQNNIGPDKVENFGDFNDMIVRVTTVPEPTSLILLGTGLLGLGYFGRRRKS